MNKNKAFFQFTDTPLLYTKSNEVPIAQSSMSTIEVEQF